jgi:poly(A) polymerase
MVLKTKVAPHIIEIVKKLQNAGFETYIVGGAVRDVFLDRQPKDYDISTSATPIEIRRVFGRKRTYIIGRRFQIVHLHHGREIIEISTFRKEPSKQKQEITKNKIQRDLPDNLIFRDNEFGTSYEDAWRRDFTVNALFYDPVHDEVLDHTGMGLDDLKEKTVRSIGDPTLRFEEDPVRILRALKLVGQYDFKLDQAINRVLPDSLDLITHCSFSRLSLELEKILKNPYGDNIISAFYQYGFLEYFLPFVHKNWHSPETEKMLDLWSLRNDRMQKGYYRNSISLAIALTCLPFLQKELASEEGNVFWNNYTGIEYDIRNMISKFFYPRTFCKRIVASAVKILLIQPKFFQTTAGKLLRHPAYPHARELIEIQNQLYWHDEKLTETWPLRKFAVRRKRRNTPRKKRS